MTGPEKEDIQMGELDTPGEWRGKITISWLVKHMPLDLWVKCFVFLFMVFSFGYGLNDLYPGDNSEKDSFVPDRVETCWNVKFGMGDLDWSMDVSVPSKNTACTAENIKPNFTYDGSCDSFFKDGELFILMLNGSTLNNGVSAKSNQSILKAPGSANEKIIEGSYIDYGQKRPWRAERIKCD